MDFDNFSTTGNRNKYSTKVFKLIHFNLTMSSLYLVKLKITQKQPTAYMQCILLKRLFQTFPRKSVNVRFLPYLLEISLSSFLA